MVVKNDESVLKKDEYKKTPETTQKVYQLDSEIVSLCCTDDSTTLLNHSELYKTPKSQKINVSGEVKRWASVVKNSKNRQEMARYSENDNQVKTSEMIDSVFKGLPQNFEAQKGFIISQNTSYFCIPCTFELDSVIAIANHLKTRKHEDCVILFFKGKLPPQLENIMEYVSFFGFSLCCNLCRCSIDMSSYNPYETIVNIVAHNASKMHLTPKATCDTYSGAHVSDLVKNSYNVEQSNPVGKKISTSSQNDECKLDFAIKSDSDKKIKKTLAFDKSLVVVPENKSTAQDKQSRLKDLLSAIPSGLMHIDCIVENDKGSITCLICNRVVPPSSHNLYTHLVGSNHKRNKERTNASINFQESMKQNEVTGVQLENSALNNVYESNIAKKVPERLLRSSKILSVQKMPPKDLANYFKKIISNPLISENDSFLVRSVDGRNSYCKLCRSLIPLSTDLSVLEKNLIEHFQSIKHKGKFSQTKLLSSKQRTPIAGSGRVSRSLFALSDVETENCAKEAEINSNYSKENQDPSNKPGTSYSTQTAVVSQKKENGDVEKTTTTIKNVKYLNIETEQDEVALTRRLKQISYGKNTAGYSRYCQLVPKKQRKRRDPVTPPHHVKCSRRAWDGMVRTWRQQLHKWDPPQPVTTDDFPWLKPLPSD